LLFHHGLPPMVFIFADINYEGGRDFFAIFISCPHF